MNRILSRLDLTAMNAGLRIEGNEKFPTPLGGIVTALASSIILAYCGYQMN